MYVKLGLRNAPNIYPSGLHLARPRRAGSAVSACAAPSSCSDFSGERAPDLVEGRGDDHPPDLGIPEP